MLPKRGPHHCGLGLAHHEFKNSIHLMEITSKLFIVHPEKIPLHSLWHQAAIDRVPLGSHAAQTGSTTGAWGSLLIQLFNSFDSHIGKLNPNHPLLKIPTGHATEHSSYA